MRSEVSEGNLVLLDLICWVNLRCNFDLLTGDTQVCFTFVKTGDFIFLSILVLLILGRLLIDAGGISAGEKVFGLTCLIGETRASSLLAWWLASLMIDAFI